MDIFRVKSLEQFDNMANKPDKVNAFYYSLVSFLRLCVIPPNDAVIRSMKTFRENRFLSKS